MIQPTHHLYAFARAARRLVTAGQAGSVTRCFGGKRRAGGF
jgi:hypothetical protein